MTKFFRVSISGLKKNGSYELESVVEHINKSITKIDSIVDKRLAKLS